jgi:hypothetical protein
VTPTFTYSGDYDGHPVTGRVADGKITGNPFVTIQVQRLVANKVHVGLGPWSGEATLDDEQLARATIAALIQWPRFDRPPPMKVAETPLPPGAVY